MPMPAPRMLAALLLALGFAAPAAAETGRAPEGAGDCRPGTTAGAPCPNLTDKLDSTDGVIKPPPGIDPDIRTGAPAPNPRTTPVIPPSALPEDQPPPKE